MNVDAIKDIMDGDMVTAFNLMDNLEWGDRKGTYNDLKKKWITPPQGESKDTIRDALKVLLSNVFNQTAQGSNNSKAKNWYEKLLAADFLEQKTKMLSCRQKKLNIIVAANSPTCGIHYFIKFMHKETTPLLVKFDAEQNSFDWPILAEILGVKIDFNNKRLHVPTSISFMLVEKLKEKSLVLVFYSTQPWDKGFFSKLVSLLKEIPTQENWKNNLYVYVVYEYKKDKLTYRHTINLPVVKCLSKKEHGNLYVNATLDKLFPSPEPANFKTQFKENKFLSQVIDFFMEQSVCGAELKQYFNQITPLH